MGAFNTVRITTRCPRCQTSIAMKVQFKYGDTWQYEYGIGDALRWGGNDIGESGKRSVVVDGVADAPCSSCRYDDKWEFYIFIEDNKITRVTQADGTHDFVVVGRTYIVLQE